MFLKEPGQDQVAAVLNGAVVSAVNMSEVYATCGDRGLDVGIIGALAAGLPIILTPFDDRHALEAGRLRALTKSRGLSLGDRACLATARLEGKPVLTADKAWLELGLDLDIRLIR
jgi:PIN domain nuclease of toxin-antitoxin system